MYCGLACFQGLLLHFLLGLLVDFFVCLDQAHIQKSHISIYHTQNTDFTTSMGQGNSAQSDSQSTASSVRLTPSRVADDVLTLDDVRNVPLVPHFVYALLSEHVYNDPDRRPLPPDWSVLMTCAEVDLDREGYFAVAYVNKRLRHCIIAERGTSDALGIRAGVWMYFDEPTIQFSLAEQFSKLVRLRLSLTQQTEVVEGNPQQLHSRGPSTVLQPYLISYTGHSLGAVLAACRACAEHTYAITFESPGCKTFVEKTMHPFRADDVDIITYLRSPNPINTLKPQCGYLVQLPYVPAMTPSAAGATRPTSSSAATGGASAAAANASLSTTVASSLKFSLPTLPSPQEYLKNRFIAGSPEIQQYLNKIEPMLKELLEHTQQIHSIHSIVSNFEIEDEPTGQDVVLVWPSHIMQFLEYYNITKAMEDPNNQSPNVYAAYDSLLQRLYLTAKRPKSRMPLRFLRKDAQKLVRMWSILKPEQKKEFPLLPLEVKALNTTSIHGENMQTSVLTAFQMKQYLSIMLARDEVKVFLDKYAFDLVEGKASKL